jgi:hypothetical protein
LIFGCAGSCAHEGHDHGETNNAVSSAYPRVAARSELYEIVGVLRDNQLSIYLDDALTNEPVADATLQVTVGDSTAVEASKAGGGFYTLALPVQPAQSVEVIFSVSAQKGDDLLVDSLAAPPPASAPQAHEHGRLSSNRLVPAFAVGAAGLALLFGYSIRSGSRLAATVSVVASTIVVVLAA